MRLDDPVSVQAGRFVLQALREGPLRTTELYARICAHAPEWVAALDHDCPCGRDLRWQHAIRAAQSRLKDSLGWIRRDPGGTWSLSE